MENLFCLRINCSISLEEAWDKLENNGVKIFYGTEEGSCSEFYISLDSWEALGSFDWILNCKQYTLPQIDWQAQWASHAPAFHRTDGAETYDFSHGRKRRS